MSAVEQNRDNDASYFIPTRYPRVPQSPHWHQPCLLCWPLGCVLQPPAGNGFLRMGLIACAGVRTAGGCKTQWSGQHR